MTNLRKFLEDQTHLERLLNSFEFSHQIPKVIDSIEQAAYSHSDTTGFLRSSSREKDTFIFHMLSLYDLIEASKKLEEELNRR